MKCSECGKEVYCGDSLYSCAVCGAKVCSSCVCQLSEAYKYPVQLCPAHYSQVREHIEGLKPGFVPFRDIPSGYGDRPLVERDANGAPTTVYVNGVKFVPENSKFDVHFDKELGIRGQYVMMDFGTDRAFRVDGDAADALYSYMRAERDE